MRRRSKKVAARAADLAPTIAEIQESEWYCCSIERTIYPTARGRGKWSTVTGAESDGKMPNPAELLVAAGR
jgi:hypothetical protein